MLHLPQDTPPRRPDCDPAPAPVVSRLRRIFIGLAPAITEPARKEAGTLASHPAERLFSLDVFRGITVAAMILVNDPGSWSHVYPPLAHAAWNGWTFADLIFPFFLFIAGVAIPLAFASRVRRHVTRGALAVRVIRRSILIFTIGLLLNAFPGFDFASLRIMGVLQRIALCYLAAGLLYIAICRDEWSKRAPSSVPNAMRIAAFVTIILGLLAGYWALLTFVPAPGSAAGSLDPTGNLAAYLDRALLGNHLWQESKTWDPEGLLSTLPAVATTLLGVLSGMWLRAARDSQRNAAGLIPSGSITSGSGASGVVSAGLVSAGTVLALAGLGLQRYFPINKNLWTSTYALFTGGLAMIFFGVLYEIVDARRWRHWAAPFLVFGTNAILAYALAALLEEIGVSFEFQWAKFQSAEFQSAHGPQTIHGWIYQTIFAPHASPENASLAFAMAFVLLILILVWPLYRRKVFLRI